MGAVFLARHAELGRRVALKVMLGNMTIDPELRVRFQREAQAAVEVVHPGLARLYDFDLDGAHPYMAMEYVQGCNLQQLLAREGPLPLPRALDLVRQALQALAACHAAGLIHRDLKPANLMLDTAGRLLVMDLGLVHLPGRTMLTTEGQVMGSPRYWPPEMVMGDPVDHRADLYQIGLILHELLTGKPVYHGIPVPELSAAIVTRPLPPPPPMEGPLAARVTAFLARTMAREPAERFGSAREALAFLSREKDSRPVSRPSASSLAPRAPASIAPAATPRRSTAAAALVLLFAGLGLAGLARRPRPPAPDPHPSVSATPSPVETPAALTSAAIDELVRGLADAVKFTRDRDIHQEMSRARAQLARMAEPARAATLKELRASYKQLLATPRFSVPIRRYLACSEEVWSSDAPSVATRAQLVFRITELQDIAKKMEQHFGVETGIDLARFVPARARIHSTPHPRARAWHAWFLGDGGKAAGRVLPDVGLPFTQADPLAVFSTNDADVIVTGAQARHRQLKLEVPDALPRGPGGALPDVHVSYRLAEGHAGERLMLKCPAPDGPDGTVLGSLQCTGAAVSEGCVRVDARPFAAGLRELSLRMHGKGIERIPKGVTLDYLVVWCVEASP